MAGACLIRIFCREADELRQLLAEGTAPSPPKFWSAKPGHPDVGENNDTLKDELLLCWRPQPGAAVRTRPRRIGRGRLKSDPIREWGVGESLTEFDP